MATIHEAVRELTESQAELRAHVAKVKNPWPPQQDFRYTMNGADRLQLQWRVDMRSPRAPGMLLWDRIDVELASAADRDAFFEALVAAGVAPAAPREGAQLHRRRDRASCPLFEFHPQRFRAFNPMGKPLAQSTDPPWTLEMANLAGEIYFRAYNSDPTSLLRTRLKQDSRDVQSVPQIGPFYHHYNVTGRQLFTFPERLVDLFKRTDVDEIPLEALNLPYNAMYLHFGPQPEGSIGGWEPDGAYVSAFGSPEHGRVLQFCLTYRPPLSFDYGTTDVPEQHFIIGLNDEMLRIGVGESVEQELSNRMATLRQDIAGASTEMITDEVRELAADHGVTAVDVRSQHWRRELEGIEEKFASWQHTMRLVVNALAYLSAYPEDVGVDWPKAPPEMVVQATRDESKAARKAHSKLAQLGYTAVRMAGRHEGSERSTRAVRGSAGAAAADEERDYTWVRGHWRRQAYGPQRSLRKLRWLMPFKRSIRAVPAEGEAGEHGHIYLVA